MKTIFFITFLFVLFNCRLFPQWNPLSSGTTEQLNSVHFTDVSNGYAAGNNGKILKTDDGGNTWISLNPGTSEDINAMYFFNNETGIVVANNGVILKTSNGGLNWNSITSGLNDDLLSISFSGSTGIIGGTSQSILRSANNGDSWTVIKSGFFGGGYRGAFMLNSSVGFVAGVNAIFAPLVGKSTNGGNNWNYVTFYVNSSEATLHDIHFLNENTGVTVSSVFGNIGGISRTINGGQNWTHQTFSNLLMGLDFPGMITGYGVGFNGLILKTTDAGISWQSLNSGVVTNLRDVSFADSLTGYAVGNSGIILKTTTGGVTSVNIISSHIPEKFELFQNYPNPFNPVTTIRFSIPQTEFVTLKVFDASGRHVAELVNLNLIAGVYEYNFNASHLTSGVYFYTLKSDNFLQSKKMLVIK